MEALNRIKKGVADTIQKADDEIRDRARREAERQVNGSRGASSSNDARSDATTVRGRTASRPDGTVVAPVARVARSPHNDAANVDVELIVTTMRSELDETRRRVDDFDARLERRLTEALGTLQDVASAQMRDGVLALVREEVHSALSVSSGRNETRTDDARAERDTFEEAMRAERPSLAPPTAPQAAPAPRSDAEATAVVASEVPSGLAESLRALEARVAAAEAEAAAAKAECARLERARAETEASRTRLADGSASGRRLEIEETNASRDDATIKALRARLEEVAEMAFSSAAAAARAEDRVEEGRGTAREKRETEDPEDPDPPDGEDGDVSASVEVSRGEARRVSEIAARSVNAEHVAFAAVESSKRATEKLDELSGTVAELAEALDAARRELRERVSRPARNARDAKTSEEDARFQKRVDALTTRLDAVETRDARTAEAERARASREMREKEKAKAKETKDGARFDDIDASLTSVAEKLTGVARNVDDRLGAMKRAVETELVAAMRDFETRLEAVETKAKADGGDDAASARASLLEARLAEATTLAESALRRVDASDAFGERAEQIAEGAARDVRKLTEAVEAIGRESENTKALAEDAARNASERAREVALTEARQTERAVWDTVMLLSADVASARRQSPFPSGARGSGSESVPSRTPSPRSPPPGGDRGDGGTPAGSTPASSGSKVPRFQALRRLFRSPRNEVSDADARGDER